MKTFIIPLYVAIVTIMLITTASSCTLLNDLVGDPPAKTSGYRLFTGRTDGLRVSFEYPDSWQRRSLKKYDTYRALSLEVSPKVKVNIDSDVNIANGGRYEDAAQLIQHYLNISSGNIDFRVLSHTKVNLDRVKGEELIIIFRFLNNVLDPHLPPGIRLFDEPQIERHFITDHRGHIYDIYLMIDADKYDTVKSDFEHLLATFRFLE